MLNYNLDSSLFVFGFVDCPFIGKRLRSQIHRSLLRSNFLKSWYLWIWLWWCFLIHDSCIAEKRWEYTLVLPKQISCQKMERMINLDMVCPLCKAGVPPWKMLWVIKSLKLFVFLADSVKMGFIKFGSMLQFLIWMIILPSWVSMMAMEVKEKINL